MLVSLSNFIIFLPVQPPGSSVPKTHYSFLNIGNVFTNTAPFVLNASTLKKKSACWPLFHIFLTTPLFCPTELAPPFAFLIWNLEDAPQRQDLAVIASYKQYQRQLLELPFAFSPACLLMFDSRSQRPRFKYWQCDIFSCTSNLQICTKLNLYAYPFLL